MALNPLIEQSGLPMLYPSEEIIETQKKATCMLQFSNGQSILRNPGTLYLTNARIIFIHTSPDLSRSNFALHFNLISDETLEISSSLLKIKGNIIPYSTFMPSAGVFTLEMSGNCETFKSHTQNFLKQIRMVSHSPVVQNKSAVNQAFVDPEDPDKIILFDKNEVIDKNLNQHTDRDLIGGSPALS